MERWLKAKVETERISRELGWKSGESCITKTKGGFQEEWSDGQCSKPQNRKKEYRL